MEHNEFTTDDENQVPVGPQQSQPRDEALEAAPTDFRRNVWLLVIILAVVAVAWVLSTARQAGGPGEAEGPQPAAPSLSPLVAPRSGAPRIPAPLLPYQVIGSEREYVLASAPRTIGAHRLAYLLPRLFDVTKKAPAFQARQVMRFPGRRADQRPILTDPGAAGRAFLPAEQVQGLAAEDRLVVLSNGQTTRAYPVKVLQTHVGVQDKIGDIPVFVCWNGLTQAPGCLVARVEGRDIEWRDAGLIHRGNSVLYDAGTGSLWDGFSGICLAGPLAGTTAALRPVVVWPWNQWKEQHPTAPVLTAGPASDAPPRQTTWGPETPAVVDLYLQALRLRTGSEAIAPKAFVLGVAHEGQARAYPLAQLLRAGAEHVTDSVGGRTIEVHVTSTRTAYATSDEQLLDAPVMLCFAWQELHPETDIYDVPSVLPEGATTTD